MTVSSQITFVCIVESGWVEAQAIRMVESLRQWGGQFANAPVLAVTPRLGLPLARKTHKAFDKLQWNFKEKIKAAKILHYHDSMWSSFWPEFIKSIQDTHPSVADWLNSIGLLKNEAPFYCRSMSKSLKYFRAKQESEYKKLGRVV